MSPNISPLLTFSDKTFLWILSSPSLVHVPPITPNLITLIIFYNNKIMKLLSVYPSAVQMIPSVFSSQTHATNIHWFKLRLMSYFFMSAKQGNSPWRWRQHVSPKYNVKMHKTFIWCLTSSGLSNYKPRNHTWPTYWYLWLTNDKSKCQFYNRVLQEGCDIHGRLWNSTVV